MKAALDLLGLLCLAVLYSSAVGFGLTLGVWSAMRFQPWSVNVQINKGARKQD